MSYNKQFLMNQRIWFAISIGISLTISMLLPFPFSLVAIIGIFILLNFYMRKRIVSRMRGGGRGAGAMFGFLINLMAV